jgi:diacylglycerol kinase (ATP)
MKTMIIFNPTAGQLRLGHQMDEVVQFLHRFDWEVDVRRTEKSGDATGFAREALDQNYDMVVAAGGDGTNNEVINGGLVGSNVIFGILPIGTTNVFALEVGIPVNNPLHLRPILDSARVLVEGRIQRIDVGQISNRYFLLMGGIGWDAEVGTYVQKNAKRWLGPLAYLPAAVRASKSFAGSRIWVDMDGEQFRDRAVLITVNNTRLYGGVVQMAPKASLDDGLLDVCIFRGQNATQAFFRYILGVLSHRHIYDPRVRYHQAKYIAVRSARPLPVHVDDEPAGSTPVEFSVATRSLRIMLPKDLPSQLLIHSNEP